MIKSKKYAHILFDLDHTLWDFDRCATETLHEIYHQYQLEQLGVSSPDDFCQVFHRVNYRLWDLYNQGEYDSERLRRERFFLVFDELRLTYDRNLPPTVAQTYLTVCPTKGHVIPGTIETLNALQNHYTLHILTNGFSDVQTIKLQHADLSDYFQTVTTSDASGYRKPDKGIFDYALNHIPSAADKCVMIGDNPRTDIQGARAAGIDSIYYNPQQQSSSSVATHEITSLTELLTIL